MSSRRKKSSRKRPSAKLGPKQQPTQELGQGRFPQVVCDAMVSTGAMATCVPVRLQMQEAAAEVVDSDSSEAAEPDPSQVSAHDWQAALFIQVSGPESSQDIGVLRNANGRPLGIGFEADLIETEAGTVVVVRVEIFTRPRDPLIAEILLTPGDGENHFDTLKLLSSQPRLSWFFADEHFNIIHSQCHPLNSDAHASFDEILKDALKHDSMVRMTARYDAAAALSAVTEHYRLRDDEQAVEDPDQTSA